jgi:tripartite ATP-independent transporter DctP family solute receptor
MEFKERDMRNRIFAVCAAFAAAGLMVEAGPSNGADIKEHTIRFSYVNVKGHPQDLGATKFAELVAQKSGNKIQVKLFPGGTLGGDVQSLSAVQGGTLDMTSMNSGILQSHVKEFAILDFPFLFNDAKEADAVVDGPIGKKLADKLPEKGIINLVYWELGFRQLNNSKRPITKVEDIAGLKIRVIQSPIYIDIFNALGANAVPMPFPEVYSALEQKTIDGQENPLKNLETTKMYEVAKYVSLTRHIYNPMSVLISKKTWDKLNADEKKIIQDAANETRDFQRKASRDAEAQASEALTKAGALTNPVAPAEIQRMRDKVKPVVDKYTKEVGEAFVKEIYAEIDKVRGKK